jgi:hypothetical protein
VYSEQYEVRRIEGDRTQHSRGHSYQRMRAIGVVRASVAVGQRYAAVLRTVCETLAYVVYTVGERNGGKKPDRAMLLREP